MDAKEFIAKRTAKFFKDGDLVNLGIGMPTKCMAYIDPDIVDAGGAPTGIREGGCCFSSFTSFGYIRGGHVDYTVLGAYEVDQNGNLANWMIPGKAAAGMGGAMDLVTGAKCTIVMTVHCDKTGASKIVRETKLPLTGVGVVDYVVTEKCVFHFTDKGMVLEEIAPGETVEHILEITPCDIIVADDVKCME
ncbi:MAG: succinyl-CoA--3-ketoacid-CoA transferase [Oscillospiraceae bacterium]|nr:succinyl-CoA--3-ketoacid-CoA transferase [Oscillospiraceae bacterium]